MSETTDASPKNLTSETIFPSLAPMAETGHPVSSTRATAGAAAPGALQVPAPLADRGLSAVTVGYFRLRLEGTDLCYPILDEDGRPHRRGRQKLLKRTDGQPKYRFTGPPSIPVPAYYHPAGFDQARQAGGDLIIASGEPIVWLLWELGCPNVVCWFGEGHQPADLVDRLRAHDIRRVITYTDRDATGDQMARRLAERLKEARIDYLPRQLPGPWRKSGGPDLEDFWMEFRQAGDSGERFRRALEGLPVMDLAMTRPPGALPSLTGTRPSPASEPDADERTEVRRRVCEAIHLALTPRRNPRRRGYYECPLPGHGPAGKDFLFDQETGQIGGCQGQHRGELTRWRDLAAYLGIDVTAIARQVAEAHASRQLGKEPARKAGDGPPPSPETRCWPQGMIPRRVAEILLGAHLFLEGVPNLGPLVVGWLVWHEAVAAGWVDASAVLTRRELETALLATGRNVAPATMEKGLEQLAALGIFRKMTAVCCIENKCNENMSVERGTVPHDPDRKEGCQMPKKSRGRPPYRYQAVPLAEAVPALCAWLDRHRRGLWKKEALAAEALTPARREGRLADITTQARDQKAYERKLQTLARMDLAGLLADGEGLFIPGEAVLANARQLRDEMQKTDIATSESGERQMSVARQGKRYGTAPSTVYRMRERNQVITRSAVDEFPLQAGRDVLQQIAAVAPYALKRSGGVVLVSTSGEWISLRQAKWWGWRDGDYNRWLKEQTDAGHTVSLHVQAPSIERLATPEEWEAYQTGRGKNGRDKPYG